MESFVQALIIAFREGLEAFLILAILLKFLEKTNNDNLKKNAWWGLGAGVLASVLFGFGLMMLGSLFGGTAATAKIWESVASIVAVVLITTFIVWMINHGDKIKQHIEKEASVNLSKKGIFLLVLIMVVREGVEIAIFSFAGDYSFLPVVLGIILASGLVLLIYYSLVRINLKTIFTITLAYLILQAGFLVGYGVHEGLSAAKTVGVLDESHPLYTKAFDVSNTQFNHKEGVVGVPLYVAFGWYSKPEWVQFIVQYGYTLALFGYWWRKKHLFK